MSRLKDSHACALLAAAAALVYANGLNGAFLLDDHALILDNLYLRGWDNLPALLTSSIMRGANIGGSFYRPLQSLLYLIVYQAAGPSPPAFHLLNIALHAANACLVFVLGRRLGFRKGAAFFAALLWALHPMQAEAVAYISATADVLYAFFCLAGVIALLPDFTPRRVWTALGYFILALLTKETAVMFPLLAAATLFYVSDERLKPKTYLRLWPLLAAASLYVSLRIGLSGADGFGLHTQADAYAGHVLFRIYTALATLPAYLMLVLWPHGLHPERSFPAFDRLEQPRVLAGAALFLAAAAHILWSKGRRGLALGWGLLWFFAANAPQTGILLPLNGLFFEHWMYLPAAGLFLGIAESMERILPSRRARIAAAGAALLAATLLAGKTVSQNKIWRDPENLYAAIFASPDYLPRAHVGFGSYEERQGAYGEALHQFNLAIAQSNDSLADAHYDEGVVFLRTADGSADLANAAAHFRRALAIDPDLFPAAALLAGVYDRLGDARQADFYRAQAAQIYKRVTAFYRPR